MYKHTLLFYLAKSNLYRQPCTKKPIRIYAILNYKLKYANVF